MTTMISEVYSAFRTAGVPEEEAKKAAEALSAESLASKNDIVDVKRELTVVKCCWVSLSRLKYCRSCARLGRYERPRESRTSCIARFDFCLFGETRAINDEALAGRRQKGRKQPAARPFVASRRSLVTFGIAAARCLAAALAASESRPA